MPTPPLALDADPRATAWRTLIEEIQADEDVRGLSINWQLPDDVESDDAATQGNITIDVSVSFGPMSPIALLGWGKRLWDTSVTLTLAITVPGTSADNSANVWRAIEVAATGAKYQPAERLAFEKRLADAGVFDIGETDIQPAMTSEDSMTAIGTIVIDCQIER